MSTLYIARPAYYTSVPPTLPPSPGLLLTPSHTMPLACTCRCARVRCVDPECRVRGKDVTVMIVDQCPECKKGDLDFSIPAYRDITGTAAVPRAVAKVLLLLQCTTVASYAAWCCLSV